MARYIYRRVFKCLVPIAVVVRRSWRLVVIGLLAVSSNFAVGSVAQNIDASRAAVPSSVRPVIFDLRRGHPFLGLATVIWPGAPFEAQRRAVLSATQMNWVRIPLTTTFRESDERSGMSVGQLIEQRADHALRAAVEHLSPQQVQALRAEDKRALARYRDLAAELSGAGIRFVVVALPGVPKNWVQNYQFQGVAYTSFMGGQPGQPDHRQDFVTLAVAEIITARQAGLAINGVEMPFEPDEPGSGMRPDVANAMVGKLRHTLDANGLTNVVIVAPGTGSTATAARWIAAMAGPGGHLDDVRYFSAHDYGLANVPVPAGLSPSFLKATQGTKPILVTEFNDSSPRWSQPPYIGSPRHSPPEEGLNPANAANHSEFATSVVAEGLKLIGDGATGICVWEMNDIYWKKTSYGMIDLHGGIRPTVAAFATWMQQVGRSSDVVAFGADAGIGLGAAAFRVTRDHQSGLIAVLANSTRAAMRVRVVLKEAAPGNRPGVRSLSRVASFPGVTGVDDAGPITTVPAGSIVVMSDFPR